MPRTSAPSDLRAHERVQLAVGRRLLRVPRPLVRRFDGDPVVVDGQRLDEQARWALQVARLAGPDLNEMTVRAARRRYRIAQRAVDARPPAMGLVWNRTVSGPAGPLRARLYVPARLRRPPLLVYFHGGGFVVGDLDSHDVICRLLALETPCAVAAVEYRLAPEAPFPAAVEDAWAAYRVLRNEAAALGFDPQRVAVGGDSAGGTLAAVVSRLGRDADVPPRAQLLVYPSTDPFGTYPSAKLFAEGFGLTTAMRDWFLSHYAPTRGDPRAAPLRNPDLAGLPPACIAIAGFDPLRDEGEAYAARLREADVPVELQRYPSLFHGFLQVTGVVDTARAATSAISAGLARCLQ